MGSGIQYSTEIFYPSVSFFGGMGEVARKPTNEHGARRRRKVGGQSWGRTGGHQAVGQILPKEAGEWRSAFLQKSPSHQRLNETFPCSRPGLGPTGSREPGGAQPGSARETNHAAEIKMYKTPMEAARETQAMVCIKTYTGSSPEETPGASRW